MLDVPERVAGLYFELPGDGPRLKGIVPESVGDALAGGPICLAHTERWEITDISFPGAWEGRSILVGPTHSYFSARADSPTAMVHCPECETTLDDADDIEFVETDSSVGFIKASKRFYTANCAACGRTLGSGVAGAKSNGGGAGAV